MRGLALKASHHFIGGVFCNIPYPLVKRIGYGVLSGVAWVASARGEACIREPLALPESLPPVSVTMFAIWML